MPNGKCPKCGGPSTAYHSYCLPCNREWNKVYKRTHPQRPPTESERLRRLMLDRKRRANLSPEARRIMLDNERAYRIANPVSESKMQERRDKALAARRKWSPERLERQKQTQKAHYDRMQLRPEQGLCAYSVNCNEAPIHQQKFCLFHWCVGIRFSDPRIKAEYSVQELVDLWIKQDGKCAITGVPLIAGETAAIDHIIPVSRGGDGSIRNLRFIHTGVNRAKWTMTDLEFKAFILEFGPKLTSWSNNQLT